MIFHCIFVHCVFGSTIAFVYSVNSWNKLHTTYPHGDIFLGNGVYSLINMCTAPITIITIF